MHANFASQFRVYRHSLLFLSPLSLHISPLLLLLYLCFFYVFSGAFSPARRQLMIRRFQLVAVSHSLHIHSLITSAQKA